jgi:hypothetical protein
LYFTYFAIFATRLQSWNEDVPFACYNTEDTSRPGSHHPRVDRIYIGFAFAGTIYSLLYASSLALSPILRCQVLSWKRKRVPPKLPQTLGPVLKRILGVFSYSLPTTRKDLLTTIESQENNLKEYHVSLACLQSLVYIYMIFALRHANEPYLGSNDASSEWGFGQVVALALLGANILPIVHIITSKFIS